MSARGTGLGSRSRPWLPSVKAADLPVAGCKDDFDDCSMIAENNWCNEENFATECFMSCKLAEESKDPDCYVIEKDKICKNYPVKCKKTCRLC